MTHTPSCPARDGAVGICPECRGFPCAPACSRRFIATPPAGEGTAGSGWRPIETAVKDEDAPYILVACDYEDDPNPAVERLWEVTVARWDNGWEGGIDSPSYGPTWVSAVSGDFIKPTHWQPLPSPPNKQAADATVLPEGDGAVSGLAESEREEIIEALGERFGRRVLSLIDEAQPQPSDEVRRRMRQMKDYKL